MRISFALLLCSVAMTPVSLSAEVIGTQVSAEPLTEARIAALPPEQRAVWTAYLARSRALMEADKAALRAERAGLATLPPAPGEGPSGGGGMPLDRDPAWYGSAEARAVADNIVSFQTPAGGWSKNQDRAGPKRQRGQGYVAKVTPGKEEQSWSYVGTLDNNATWNELSFLARVQSALGAEGEPYRAAFLKGLRYLLTAQYPNGGWPQIYPLTGGYHDAITFNDDVFSKAASLMAQVGKGEGDYAFVPADLRAQAGNAAAKAVELALATQVTVDGKRTVWGQQHDPLTLQPVGARNFEPVALSSGESAGILVFLMKQPDPSPRIVAAVHDGVAWLRARALHDLEWAKTPDGGRELVAKPGAKLLWSRFYDMKTFRPIFGDRDKTIHDDVMDLSPERRNGYSWYNTTPQKALDAYEKWSKRFPAAG